MVGNQFIFKKSFFPSHFSQAWACCITISFTSVTKFQTWIILKYRPTSQFDIIIMITFNVVSQKFYIGGYANIPIYTVYTIYTICLYTWWINHTIFCTQSNILRNIRDIQWYSDHNFCFLFCVFNKFLKCLFAFLKKVTLVPL